MMSLTAAGEEGDGSARPITVPLDLRLDEGPPGDDRRGRLRRWSVAAAALLHAAVLVWLLWDWRRAPPEPPPPAIAVTLVPAPAPPAAPPKPAPPEPLKFRESGKDERTTAPAAAETEGPQASAPPEAAPAPKPPTPEPPLPAERPGTLPAPSGAKKEAQAPVAPRKPGPRAAAPRKAPARPQVELGEREETGDPYLNRLRDLIERHRLYPPAAAPLGLQGVAEYNVLIDRAGHLVGVTLIHSSGASILDEAGVRMIRDAAPFPPLPPGYPGQAVLISITLPIFPPEGAR